METIKNLSVADYNQVITQLDLWWGGRTMTDMLPRLFFEHFCDTSYCIKEGDAVKGFIVGFVSPVHPSEAYVHFIGVNPDYRRQAIGRRLYDLFIQKVKAKGASRIACVTSPQNTKSIAFHQSIGFLPKHGTAYTASGLPYFADYDGPEEHRVLLELHI